MVPPKDNIVSCKVAVKIAEFAICYGSLASCIALGQPTTHPPDPTQKSGPALFLDDKKIF
jgi:hypothetical protein